MNNRFFILLFIIIFVSCQNDADWKHKEANAQEKILSLRHSATISLKFDNSCMQLIDSIKVAFAEKRDFENAKIKTMQRSKDGWQTDFTDLHDSATYYLCYKVSPVYMQIADSISSFQAINHNPPLAKTFPANSITYTTAVLYGSAMQGEDNYEIIERGFYYSLIKNGGDYECNKVVCGKGEGDFSIKIEHLRANADYYFCAYASNRNGETCADTLTFHTENPY